MLSRRLFEGVTDILKSMAQKKPQGFTTEEYRDLILDIVKRTIISGLVLCGVGLAIISLVVMLEG